MKKVLKETFLELFAFDEVYPHEDNVAQYILSRLQKGGVPVDTDSFGNIIATLPGTGDPLLLSTHMDIPEQHGGVVPDIRGDLIHSDGTGVLGADPKSGLAVLIELIIALHRSDTPHIPIEAVITRGEEAGLIGASHLDYSRLTAKRGIVLDEDGPISQVVTQSPSQIEINIDLIGKESHARDPKEGINALEILHYALAELPWGYITEGVTWNIGVLKVGTARNTIPGRARLEGELRSYDKALLTHEAARIKNAFTRVAKKYGAEVHIEQEERYEGYTHSPNLPLIQEIVSVLETMNLQPNFISTFGATDANVFNQRGITTVTMGCGCYNAHQYTEYADLRDMEEIYNFLWKFVY